MILDSFAQFTGGTAATGTAPGNADGTDSPTATSTSSQIIDLHSAGLPILANGQGARDMGIGDDPALKLNVQVTLAFLTLTSLQVSLQGATDNGSGAPAAFNTMLAGAVVPVASLIAGAQLLPVDMPRPPQGVAIPRFLQLAYTIAGAAATAGKVRGNVVLDRFDQPYLGTNDAILGGYPAGVVVAN